MKTVKQLLDNSKALHELVVQKMPIATAYKLGKMIKECDVVIELFESHKKELFEKFGNVLEDGNIEIPKEKVEAFGEEINVYLDEEIDIAIPKITIEQLGNIEIEPSVLTSLDWLITD